MTTSDIIASLALLVTIVCQVRSELKSKKSDSEQRVMKAELGARLVKVSKNNYRLKIFNRGKIEARSIEIQFPDNDGDEYLVMRDVADKFPYEVLHPQHGIEIIACMSFESKSKYRLKLIWDDNYKRRNEEEFFVSI